MGSCFMFGKGTFKSTRKKASDYAAGESVFLNVNGTPTEFLVVHQGLPDATLYDASCDGTWLLMKDLYAKKSIGTSNNYETGTLHTYLNDTVLALLDNTVQSMIKQVKIPFHTGQITGTLMTGSSGLSTKIFLLSGYEVGIPSSFSAALPADGVCLSYFTATSSADSKRIAYLNGTATNWWLRSPSTTNGYFVYYMGSDGSPGATTQSSAGIRPAIILPFNTMFDIETNEIA